MFLNNIKTA